MRCQPARATNWRRAAALYAAAEMGAYLSFVPLFVLLLPRRVEAVAPAGPIALLSLLIVVGGATASLANIGAGAIGDAWLRRHGSRRGQIALGLGSTVVALALIGLARKPDALVAGIMLYQLALNLMFSPLGALLADYFPDALKGRMAALINAALPLASLGTAATAALFPSDDPWAFVAVAAAVAACVVPLLVFWPFAAIGAIAARAPVVASAPARGTDPQLPLRDFIAAFSARFLLQVGAAFVVNYFYLYLSDRLPAGDRTGSAGATEQTGQLALLTGVVLVSTLIVGHWSDLRQQRRWPMTVAALLGSGALLLIATGGAWPTIIAGYVGFQACVAIFMAIDSALVAQLLGAYPRRGAMLGVMNLTNTVPAIAVASVALFALGGHRGIPWTLCFEIVAACALGAGILVQCIRTVR